MLTRMLDQQKLIVKERLTRLLNRLPWLYITQPTNAPTGSKLDDEAHWLDVYDARCYFYDSCLGPCPSNIIKLSNLSDAWPRGGLYRMPAAKLDKRLWIYTTFGLTNPDMSLKKQPVEQRTKIEFSWRANSVEKKPLPAAPIEVAGRGYEMLLITKGNFEWPLWIMLWCLNTELVDRVSLLKRVDKFDGFTVQDIHISETTTVCLLIARAQEPLPPGSTLPNGQMDLLVATVITRDEMDWAKHNGCPALLKKLAETGVDQVSDLHRESVLQELVPG